WARSLFYSRTLRWRSTASSRPASSTGWWGFRFTTARRLYWLGRSPSLRSLLRQPVPVSGVERVAPKPPFLSSLVPRRIRCALNYGIGRRGAHTSENSGRPAGVGRAARWHHGPMRISAFLPLAICASSLMVAAPASAAPPGAGDTKDKKVRVGIDTEFFGFGHVNPDGGPADDGFNRIGFGVGRALLSEQAFTNNGGA